MTIEPTELPPVQRVRPRLFRDERGLFQEVWRQELLAALGEPELRFVQENRSVSEAGVLRGIHFQLVRPQGKLVRCVRGRVWDVAVDLRRSSPSFGGWIGTELDAEEALQLWIPPGFGHGFLALESGTEVQYSCTERYHAEHDRALAWADPELAIAWPLDRVRGGAGEPDLSGRDRAAPPLSDAEVYP